MRWPARSDGSSCPASVSMTARAAGVPRKPCTSRDASCASMAARRSARAVSCSASAARRRPRSGSSRSSSSSSRGLSRAHCCASMAVMKAPASVAQAGRQEEAGLLPVALHGALGDAQGLGDLALGQAGKVAHLHDLGQARFEPGQLIQGLVHLQHVVIRLRRLLGHGGVQRQQGLATAAPLGLARPDQIDHHTAHGTAGVGEVVPAVGVALALQIGQPQPDLMHQGGGVQQGHVARLAQMPAGLAAQIVIERRHHPVAGRPVTL
mmetsp:Transcript_44091/g.77914  ORF Transcript_44091/g.77914 Transcript_44091/m.77914 type:complete len:265 (-) Transcript_44091:28-822(-)